MTFYTAIKDALLEKLGIFMFWWEENIDVRDESFTGKSAAEIALAAQDGEILDLAPDAVAPGEMPTYSFTFRQTVDKSDVKIMAVSPDDFTVAADTVALRDATYCAMRRGPGRRTCSIAASPGRSSTRCRPRQSRGRERRDGARHRRRAHRARRQCRRAERPAPGRGRHPLHQIARARHRQDGILARRHLGRRDQIDRDGEAEPRDVRRDHALSGDAPLYGRSLADLLLEVQRIKTALTRMVLELGHFALNQRVEVSTDQAGEYTISDLLRNEPGVPIRSKTGAAVRPVSSGALAFDAFGALEYFATVAESRTGIVRNAQGLNPDTLHDFATGAMALINAAQKRVRLIARIFAESGSRTCSWACMRSSARTARPRAMRDRGQSAAGRPHDLGQRNEMTIEIGLGASGQAHDLAMATQASTILQQIVAGQGGAQGPIVTEANVYAMASYIFGKLGIKAPERFLTNPSDPNAPRPPAPPQPPEL